MIAYDPTAFFRGFTDATMLPYCWQGLQPGVGCIIWCGFWLHTMLRLLQAPEIVGGTVSFGFPNLLLQVLLNLNQQILKCMFLDVFSLAEPSWSLLNRGHGSNIFKSKWKSANQRRQEFVPLDDRLDQLWSNAWILYVDGLLHIERSLHISTSRSTDHF